MHKKTYNFKAQSNSHNNDFFPPGPHFFYTHISPNLKSWIVYVFLFFFPSANQLRRGKVENVCRSEEETPALLLEG